MTMLAFASSAISSIEINAISARRGRPKVLILGNAMILIPTF